MGKQVPPLEDLVISVGPDADFWKDRRVLLTGHTGFKGAWAAVWLNRLGARTTGFALPADTDPSLWQEAGTDLLVDEYVGDLADRNAVQTTVKRARPEIVLHMAAQSLVRRSFARPVETFATNLMGTVHLLDALRGVEDLRAVLVITTDKVYANTGERRDFVENDPLGGHDPYSASKAAAEIATASYASAYFEPAGVSVATARAGNVIGGGDWSEDRLIPDVWRAAAKGEQVALRNPEATRPWQHVVEPIAGYLAFAKALARGAQVPRALNFGPLPGESVTVSQVAETMSEALGAKRLWRRDERPAPSEATQLSLDPSRAIEALGWRPRLRCAEAVQWSAHWYSQREKGVEALRLCQSQIEAYEALA